MIRIVLFLLLIALAAAGAAWVADQPGDVVLSWGGYKAHDHAAGVRARDRHRRRRGDDRAGDAWRAVAHAGAGCAGAVTSAATPAAGMRSRKGCSRSAMAIPPPPASMPMPRGGSPATIRWRCCCTRNRRSSTATAPARSAAFSTMAEREDTRLLGLRGLFIEAQRADDAVAAVLIAEEALKLVAGLDLGLACGARLPLRAGRLGRRAENPRQRSRLRPDRQGGLSPPPRRAAHRARARAGEGRPRSVAREPRWKR